MSEAGHLDLVSEDEEDVGGDIKLPGVHRGCVRACVHVCVRACMCVCVCVCVCAMCMR